MELKGFYSNVSVNRFLSHLHILCAKWQTLIYFNKTETAIQLQTTVHASDFIFNLGVTAATWPHADGRSASPGICWSVLCLSHLQETDWEALLLFCKLHTEDPRKDGHPAWQSPLAKIGRPRPKLKMSVKTNSVSKGPCTFPPLCSPGLIIQVLCEWLPKDTTPKRN